MKDTQAATPANASIGPNDQGESASRVVSGRISEDEKGNEPSTLEETNRLWPSDTGELSDASRRALLEIIKGPYLSGRAQPGLWAALVADETVIRSRLNDIFLDLVMDRTDEYAFTRKVDAPEIHVPAAVRTESLLFIDTVMILVLRQILLAAPGEPRVIIGRKELYERLADYREPGADAVTYARNLNGAWNRMLNKFRVLHGIPGSNDRAEVSPVVKFLIDENRIRQLEDTYRGIAAKNRDAIKFSSQDALAVEARRINEVSEQDDA
ncbi:MAG: DUF4194 domain-containing protein [Pseudoclavibacter sp.]